MTKQECVRIFNSSIRGTPVSFQTEIIPLISEYLIETNVKNPQKLISFLIEHPDFVEYAFPTVRDYYCRKYTIYSVIYNNQIILYYL